MGKLGDIEVADSTASHKSGAALLLNQEPSEDNTIQIGSDWEVELEQGNPYAVARGQTNYSVDDVLLHAHEAIQKALDIFSFQNEGDFSCKDVDRQRLIWWRENSKQHIRAVNISPLGVSTSAAIATTGGSNQQSNQQTSSQATWHECLRYFRLAQTTDDLFDAYRNVYLALEMILSHRDPQQNEGEKAWFKRALGSAHQQFDLSKFAPNPQNPVDSIVQQQYKDTRVKLFHSKKGRSKLLPHDEKDREHVQEAFESLTSIVVKIIRNELNIHRGSGGMTHSGFEFVTSWITNEKELEVKISSDSSPLDSGETLTSSPWQNSHTLSNITYSKNHSKPGLRCVLSSDSVANIGQKTIRRMGLVKHDDDQNVLISIGSTEADLTLKNVDQFEVLKGIELQNKDRAKTRFQT
ncbi:methylamine utilization protein MauJ [Haloferax gibbonsii]|uniref:methylamine utilization protein MauJ n=1 Tax=Haloferax gibbonsii TaxID=35746 RepID=UPI0012681BCA|nr:hypothetical protein [Haloferax gibbonsii]